MRIEVRFKDDVAIVVLTGRFLAGSDGPFLRQKIRDLIDAGARMMVLDFSGVPYIDSTGLGFLAGSRVTIQNAGAKMVLAGVNAIIKKTLDQVRLSQFFEMADDVTVAVSKVRELAQSSQGPGKASAKDPKGPSPPAASGE